MEPERRPNAGRGEGGRRAEREREREREAVGSRGGGQMRATDEAVGAAGRCRAVSVADDERHSSRIAPLELDEGRYDADGAADGAALVAAIASHHQLPAILQVHLRRGRAVRRQRDEAQRLGEVDEADEKLPVSLDVGHVGDLVVRLGCRAHTVSPQVPGATMRRAGRLRARLAGGDFF